MQGIMNTDRLQQSDALPLSLGRYRLLDELGRGGMGRVYKALHTIMGRVVALKIISPELVSDPVAVEWFLREVRASTQLSHPNIVMAYDANEAEGLRFLVMEYVHGMTLDALVKRQGSLPITYVCALMRQAALGLQHAHEKGMVHRDIKPGNLLIPHPEGDAPPEVLVKIVDFGLARLHGKTKGDTIALRGEAGVLGTPDYIAPEQSRDIHSADIRSDLYSLGCVFYFALTGCVPFPGDNALEKIIKHLTEQPEPLEKMRSDVPPALAALVRRLMAKHPADRFQTPAELARELEGQRPGSVSDGMSLAHTSGSFFPPQSQHTCVLDNVNVFAPSQGKAEPSGPSLMGLLEKDTSEEQHRTDTFDTLTLSRPEDTEVVTAEMITIPGGTGVSPVGALPPIDPMVFRLWRRWLGLLETVVAGRAPSRVSGDTYQTIYTLLLQACRAAIDSCPVPERRAFYEECLSIAQPWLKLQTFAHADVAMLDSLLRRCRQIEVELNNGIPPWTIRHVFALVLLALSPAGAILWYWYYGLTWLPSLLKAIDGDFSVSSLHSAWNFLHTHPALLMSVLFPLVVIFSIVLLSRRART